MNAEQKQKLFDYFQQEHEVMLLDGDFNEIENMLASPVNNKGLTFDEAEELAGKCDYAFMAKGESPINWGDATGFFLEGYNHAMQQLESSPVGEEVAFPTDEEIKAHFTVEHKPWKENPYYKILKDRIFGAKWMRDLIKQSHPSLFIHHGLTEDQRQEAFLEGWNAKENDTQGKSWSEYYEEWMKPKEKGE